MAREIFDDEYFCVDEGLRLYAHLWTEGNQLVIHKADSDDWTANFNPIMAIDLDTLEWVERMDDGSWFYRLEQMSADERIVIKEFVNFMKTTIKFVRK